VGSEKPLSAAIVYLQATLQPKTNLVATCLTPTSSVAFEEDIILPAPHPQKDAPDDGEMVHERRVNRDLGRGAPRKVVARCILIDVDYGNGRPVCLRPCPARRRSVGAVPWRWHQAHTSPYP